MGDDGNVETIDFDREMADRIRGGDSVAESRLIAAYLPGIRALVRKHCRPNDPVLDDIVQEVMMRVLVHLRAGDLRDTAALPAYVRSMAANIAIAEYRRRERGNRGESLDFVETPSSDDSPEDLTDRDCRSQLIVKLLADLPMARDRAILLRHYVLEQDQELICREVGIDQDLYRRVLHRARERLKRLAERTDLRPR